MIAHRRRRQAAFAKASLTQRLLAELRLPRGIPARILVERPPRLFAASLAVMSPPLLASNLSGRADASWPMPRRECRHGSVVDRDSEEPYARFHLA